MNVNARADSRAGPHLVLRFDHLLQAGQWQRDVRVEVNEVGRIRSLRPAKAGDDGARFPGWTVPGMPNVHSHAFQRAMAGLAEGRGQAGRRASSFWRWREVMYRFLDTVAPEDLEAIAAQLYVEMLKAGFTCVGEFHYLHRPPGGGAYHDEAETSWRILRAATAAGIGLVHMPVVYETGGFGGDPLTAGQLRFRMDWEGVARLREALRPEFGAGRRLGWAIHSLRAVSRESFAEIVDFLGSGEHASPPSARSPVHLHVAEQEREVRDCLAALGARPVEWLLDNAPVDDRWCLVHATRVVDSEVRGIAASRAVVGLCPTTEANLGDGLFPLASFVGCGGRFGIGTDSHVSRSPVEELRLLDYGQRLVLRTRSTAAHEGTPESAASGRNGLPATGRNGASGSRRNGVSGAGGALSGDGRGDADDRVGRNALAGAGGALLERVWRHGAQALAWDGGQAAVGRRADFVVLDADHPALVGRDGHAVLDSWVFSGTDSPVRHVFVGGVQVIEDGRHLREEEIAGAFRETARRLGRIRSPSGA